MIGRRNQSILIFLACFIFISSPVSIFASKIAYENGNTNNWRQLGNGPQHYGISPNTIPRGTQLKLATAGLDGLSETWGFIKSTADIFYYSGIWPQPGGEPQRVLMAMKPDGVFHAWRFVAGTGNVRLYSPALSNDEKLVYFVTTFTLFALDAATGRQVWNATSCPNGTPVVGASGTVYIAGDASQSNVHAYDGATGKLLWRSELQMIGTSFLPCSLDEKETICVAAQSDTIRIDGLSLFAINLATGKTQWKAPIAPSPAFKPQVFASFPIVRNGLVWAPLSESQLMIIDALTGKIQLNGLANYTSITSPPALAGGPILFGRYSYSFKPEKYDLCLAQNSSGKFLEVCIDSLNMTISGRVLSVPMTGPPLITKDLIAIFFMGDWQSRTGQLVAYDLQKRVRLWTSKQQVFSYHSPIITADGTIWTLTATGNLISWNVV